MIQKIKQFVLIGLTGLMMTLPGLLVPAASGMASADIAGNVCDGSNAASGTSGNSGCKSKNDPTTGLTTLAQQITKWFSIIVGAISIIMIIYGGFRYITSGGDSGKVGNAKNTLIYAIVGLIIVVLAQIIVNFVITQTGSSATNSFQ